MRVLLASTRCAGHFGPLVPFARACERAGHEVLVAAPRSAAPLVRRAGLRHAPHADPSEAVLAPIWERVRAAPSREGANAIVMEEIFAGEHARSALPGGHDARLGPDVVLRETGEFASMLLAEHLGVPHLHVSIFLAAADEIDQRAFAAAIKRLRAEAGLGTGPLPGRMLEAPYLTLAPRSLEDPGSTPPAGTLRFRAPGPAPHAAPDPEPAPLVYVSFGSVAAGGSRRLGLDALGHGRRDAARARPAVRRPAPNAQRVAELGAGLALDGPDGLREAVETVLREPAHRRGAEAVAAEIAALPPVDTVVDVLADAARGSGAPAVSRAAAAR